MTSTRSRRRSRALALFGALVAVTGLGGSAPVARAQDAATPTLGGYQGSAASSGLHAFYTPEGLLPLGALIDVGAPDALATVASGPTTFARAAAADPGDLVANPDALFTLASSDYPQGTVPAYPYRVTASSGFGAPSAESAPAPGLRAEVEATPEGSTARATMPLAEAPAVASFGSLSALATTKTDGTTVELHVRTEVSDFNLLGLLVIDSIVTDLTATSQGAGTELSGGTTISGAEVMGEPVTIDADGIHRKDDGNGSGLGLGGLIGDLNDALGAAGIRVTVAGPVEQSGGSAGQLASNGLRIDLEVSNRTLPVLADLAGALPPLPGLAPGAPSLEDVLAAAQARHIARLEVGRGIVSLSASEAAGPIDVPPLPSTGSVLPPATGASAGNLAPLPLAPTPTPDVGSTPLDATPASDEPTLPLGVGVGALGILLLLAQPFIGARLARAATGLLAVDDIASCPRKGQ